MKKGILTLCIVGTMLSFGGMAYGKTKYDKKADKVAVVEWSDRTLGIESNPKWLVNLRRGNANTFKKEFDMDEGRVIKVSMATGATEATAQALSRAGFAYVQAAELGQKVIGRVGQGLDDMGQLEAVYMAASETKAEIAGLREETGFYQKIRTPKKGKTPQSEKYIYYTIYSMDKATWDNICKKYLMDLMGTEGLETSTQKKIGALFSEMKEDADRKDEKKALEEKALYEAQMARLEAERARSNAEVAKATVEAKKLDAQEAQTKAAAEEAMDLADFLM